MTRNPLIYKHRGEVVLIDPEYERCIGTYDNDDQARRGWVVYMSQGRVGAGFDILGIDEQVIDFWREDMQQFNSRCEVKG